MTSGIPPETIVKFLWFRGILIILHIFTTTWVFGVQTPAKSKSQKNNNVCPQFTKNEKSMPGISGALWIVKALDMCLLQSIPA